MLTTMRTLLTFWLLTVSTTATRTMVGDEDALLRTKRAASDTYCGMTEFRGLSGYITTPNYPDDYPVNMNCSYYIRPTNYTDFRVNFLTCDCMVESHATCAYDYLRFGANTPKVCGNLTRKGFTALSVNGTVKVVFHSDDSVPKKGCYIVFAVQGLSA